MDLRRGQRPVTFFNFAVHYDSLWLEEAAIGWPLPLGPFESAIGFAFLAILFLGIFVGRVSGTFWLWSELRAVLIGLVTAGIIFLIGGNP